ncbi:sodium:calcium antiporter [Haloplanus aerogenes]|uniref:Cation:H+ antiporter n=1 Tax=Haloplanus aerogenes TaxID=660522 RepID=A0A3M0CZS7_9EURY|nr:sodium:calcium antiporter [Haloplanus aerogenes]AZH26734.1 sodium:calcium antiporter [Haloplanus aerogenes]RMB12979.1 cation:H+ antiporter [Haloplanus aerogenes]
MVLGLSGELVSVVLFLVGVVIVIVSVETFIEAVAEGALALGVSGFFLTVVLAGTDLENVILGIAAAYDQLPDLALGTVFGEALFILGAAVGLAGVLVPFETDVPRNYLGLMLLAPFLFFGLALDGTLSRFDGIVLTATFVPYLAIIYTLERYTDTRYLSAEEVEIMEEEREAAEAEAEGKEGEVEDEWFDLDLDLDLDVDDFVEERVPERYEGPAFLAIAIVAAIGMTIGSELAVEGAKELLALLGVTGLAFGATVMSFIASLEELFLTVEPVRQGRPHIGVGNVVGSMLFFVSANAGLIAMVHPLNTAGMVVTVHWPFFFGTMLVVAAAFYRGKVGRPTGILLLGMYAAYWVANYAI